MKIDKDWLEYHWEVDVIIAARLKHLAPIKRFEWLTRQGKKVADRMKMPACTPPQEPGFYIAHPPKKHPQGGRNRLSKPKDWLEQHWEIDDLIHARLKHLPVAKRLEWIIREGEKVANRYKIPVWRGPNARKGPVPHE
jgi:hypothetical protein